MIEAEEVHLYSRETEIIGTVQRSQLGPLPVTQLEVLRRTDGGRTLLFVNTYGTDETDSMGMT